MQSWIRILATACVASMSWTAYAEEWESDGTPSAAPDWVAAAERLPNLARVGSTTELPLTNEEPFLWRAISEEIEVESLSALSGDGGSSPAVRREVRVSYRTAPRSAAGVAFLLPAHALVGLDELQIDLASGIDRTVMVSVRDSRGLCYSFPMISIRGGDAARTYELDRSDLEFDARQSAGRDAMELDAALPAMLTIVDISSCIRPETRDVSWRLSGVRLVGTGSSKAAPPAPESADPPTASAAAASAEALFFTALNRDSSIAPRAREELLAEFLREPRNPRTSLLLGMSHLWSAAEPKRTDPSAYEHLLLAESFLERAGQLDPGEERLPSWLVPVRVARAVLEGRTAEVGTLLEPLRAANRSDPCFHSFALGLLCRTLPSDDPLFLEALASLRKTTECAEDDPSVQNLTRWPHNQEGFLLLLADFEWRAKDPSRARQVLASIERRSSYAAWPYRMEAADLSARIAADPTAARAERIASGEVADPVSWMGDHSCQVCHRGP